MLVIGLTGGIASGKSTVATLFAEKSIAIIDTDITARDLVQPKMPAYQKIVEHFSDTILQLDKQIDRRKMRNIIFNNQSEKKWLEDLLHPLIRDCVKNQLTQVKSPYCIVVIPLLAETWPCSYINHVLVVESDPQKQIRRVMERDNIDEKDAKKILADQATLEERRAIAHDIITNDADLTALQQAVDKLHEQYLDKSQA